MAKTCKDKKCPECGGEMWDNTVGKKPSKNYPDFKCKDCGHGVWLTKKEKEEIKNNPPAQEKTGGKKVSNYGNSVPPSMYGAWSVNLLIAGVQAGHYKTIKAALKDLPEVFKVVGETVNANASVPAPTSAKSSTKSSSKPSPSDDDLLGGGAEDEAKPEKGSDDNLDLGDLEDDTFDDLGI
jgi:hypothetical protein